MIAREATIAEHQDSLRRDEQRLRLLSLVVVLLLLLLRLLLLLLIMLLLLLLPLLLLLLLRLLPLLLLLVLLLPSSEGAIRYVAPAPTIHNSGSWVVSETLGYGCRCR